VILGEKTLREGLVEIKNRKTKESLRVPLSTAIEMIAL
jgi:histidyl-tRNA synthetase